MDLFPIFEASRMTQESGEPGAGSPVCLAGPSGVGKTHRVRQYGDRINYHVETIIFGRMPSVDVGGIYAPNFETNELVHMITHKLLGSTKPADKDGIIIFGDELGSCAEDQQVAIQSLVEDRVLEGRPMHPKCIWMFATNLQEHTLGANRIIQSLASRLMFIHVGPDLDAWFNLAENEWGVEKEVISYLKKAPDNLHSVDVNTESLSVPDNRRWIKVDRILKQLKTFYNKGTVGELLEANRGAVELCVSGHLGSAVCREFIAYASAMESIPKIEDILNDPKSAPIPKSGGAKNFLINGICGYLGSPGVEEAEKLTAITNILTYIARMDAPSIAFAMSRIRGLSHGIDDAIAERAPGIPGLEAYL